MNEVTVEQILNNLEHIFRVKTEGTVAQRVDFFLLKIELQKEKLSQFERKANEYEGAYQKANNIINDWLD